jgi:hypothetical protein
MHFILRILKSESLRYLPYKFRLRKVITWVMLSKFHRRANLTTILVTILRSRNHKQGSYIKNIFKKKSLIVVWVYSCGLGYSGGGGMGSLRWFKVTFTLWIISFNLFLPNKLFYEHIFHVLLWLILTNWLQTSVQTYKRTNGQAKLKKRF